MALGKVRLVDDNIERTANDTLALVSEWGVQNKLRFAPHKTNAMVITKKLKYDTPTIYMSDVRLTLVNEIKLLGLTIDNKLTFNAHVSKTCRKAADIYKQLACAAKIKWGLNKEIIRTIYVSVIEPIVLYAACAWEPAVGKLKIQDQLNSLQRGFAQKICKSYRTVSLTSALILSGQIPLDLRVRESAALFKIRKGYSQEHLPPGREVETRIGPLQNPHPAQLKTTEYVQLEDLGPDTVSEHEISGPQIYTDGSKIEGKTGAALTWWERGRESKYSTFRLEPHNTVFQSEIYALFRAIKMARKSKVRSINIMSDSRSSLDLLKNPLATHPLALEMKEDLSAMISESRSVRLFWLKAHVGTPGNERADELAKKAALTKKTAPDYDRVPISFVRRKIREEAVNRWQQRYEASTTGSITKAFFPTVQKAWEIRKHVELTPTHVQALTGHGGFAAYLHRFHLKDSPSCVCDPTKDETIWHLLFECPRFSGARFDLETGIQAKLSLATLPSILEGKSTQKPLLAFISKVVSSAAAANSSTLYAQNTTRAQLTANTHATTTTATMTPTTAPATNTPQQTPTTSMTTSMPQSAPRVTTPIPRLVTPPSIDDITRYLLGFGERGTPTLRLRPVPLFMDTPSEKLGISYCRIYPSNKVGISPGLATLLNGSTSRTSMRHAEYLALPATTFAGQQCRIVQSGNNIIVLYEWQNDTSFQRACLSLMRLGETQTTSQITARIISVDAMVIRSERGNAADQYGCIKASANHEVIVYENRGEDLSFLKGKLDSTPTAAPPNITDASPMSSSEKLQAETSRRKMESSERDWERTRAQKSTSSHFTAFIGSIKEALQDTASTAEERQELSMEGFLRVPHIPKPTKTKSPSKADLGQVTAPSYRQAVDVTSHKINAFIEFQTITKASLEVKRIECKHIMSAYQQENQKLLEMRLGEAKAAVYDNDNSRIIAGTMSGRYMAAYHSTHGFVMLDEEEFGRAGKIKFKIPFGDPIVVVAASTQIMLEDKILGMADSISGDPNSSRGWERWDKTTQYYTWVNGVPGCGKTTWIIGNFDEDKDIIVTTTTEAAGDLRRKLEHRIGNQTQSRVRTLASVLVNGYKKPTTKVRLIADEALMNHFGSIVMAEMLTDAEEVVLIGDINQLPFIERENLFELRYNRPNLVTNITKELTCTHRNPMDVAYALSLVYKGIYASSKKVRSLELKKYTGGGIEKSSPDTLYLVHTQEEKESLTNARFGSGLGSRILTIHEAQGLTYGSVVIIQTRKRKLALHDSVPHAVVAITRHTNTCAYYTDFNDDAIATFIRRSMGVSDAEITDYNLKMAIRDRNSAVIEALIEKTRDLGG